MRPFWLRRPFLILCDLFTRRERPDLDRLGRIRDAEAFVWAILPHAARTFLATVSRRRAVREIARIERAFLAAAFVNCSRGSAA